MLSTISSAVALAPLLALSMMPHHTDAHTWIDCFDTDRPKLYDQSASYIFGGAGGNGFCAGYGAGYPGRGDGDIGTSYTYKLLKNEVGAGSPVCENSGTDTYTNTDWRKRLPVAAGQTAYFSYLPNGHIVKDKKGVGTQHGIYWTGQVGTSLSTTLDMKPENLLDGHTMDYDDGNCGETVDRNGNPGGRAGDGKPCIGSFVVPAGTAPGIYNMVWYWTFWLDNESAYVDQEQSKGYFGAAYSTCFEMEVTGGGASAPTSGSIQSEAAPIVQATAPMGATPTPGETTAAPVVQEAPVAATPAPGVTPAATPVAATPAPVMTPEATTPAPVFAALVEMP
ncbi:hypothetical protein BBO99_00005956 [Phytophthora kernoviae]|uniref:Chitin-binding type-4 domain-containing protein n=2 Tax=Phytophthora kernoviae TaxID=325452 RepID=A0A3R7JY92_9STRA|nr:hypothetical protein G195_006686 [Phytophthora kernoviae 00238/432]KAG2522540.1 hypothetical protein JM16_005771 [Phytophthora kernoviae]KAG2524244.1 hypothetical protein JM18_004836 [Phytophthora kernoviae]RLN10373.1 hypothetical protein BBI17_006048 [Phytophthora kernoviae]RLN78433.1 hypothetical protein BBO99_00005956 [Phytophthora kernoviae]